jgi:hypothetical protein
MWQQRFSVTFQITTDFTCGKLKENSKVFYVPLAQNFQLLSNSLDNISALLGFLSSNSDVK